MGCRKGITLIELLIASAVLAVAVGTLLMLYVPQKSIIMNNKHKLHAIAIIEREFEKLQRLNSAGDLSSYLYTESFGSLYPISEGNPYEMKIDNMTYRLYYRVYPSGKPYRLISLGDDEDSFLRNDHLGAKVIEVDATVEWKDRFNSIQKINMIFRGQDCIN